MATPAEPAQVDTPTQMATDATPVAGEILLPEAPILVIEGQKSLWLSTDGEFLSLSSEQLEEKVAAQMPIVCHASAVAHQLNIAPFAAYDVLELFAFVHPAQFCLPTPRGLAKVLDLMAPENLEEQCTVLLQTIRHLLLELNSDDRTEKSDPVSIAWMMGLGKKHHGGPGGGWPWTPIVLAALGAPDGPTSLSEARTGPQIWHRLPEWAEHAPQAQPAQHPVSPEEARAQLNSFLERQHSEPRPQQSDYTDGIVPAFDPVDKPEEPHVVLAEAGTGVGKTLGYLAPSTKWTEKNDGAVWISTYTRNLQRQIDDELSRLYDDPVTKSREIVTRKGRENYLCLLNLEDGLNSPSLENNGQNATALGLMARWAAATKDGDLSGNDFPGWMVSLLGWGRTRGLSDRRGECIYAACSHYDKCFVEKSVRKAKRARIVIANHALVMIQTALAGDGDALPGRYVFDEGHHIFDAADSAFAGHLTGTETADLRRWILGAERSSRSRARGLQRRVEDIIIDNDTAKKALDDILETARSLPGPSWRQRLSEGKPKGVTENFLLLVRQQAYARSKGVEDGYSLETEIHPVAEGLFEAAYSLSLRLNDLKRAMDSLINIITQKLDDENTELDTETRQRMEAVSSSLRRRAQMMISGWIAMLAALKEDTPENYVDWFGVERIDGRDFDVGMYRHWVDPTIPFANAIRPHAHGMLMTSATLRDNSGDTEQDWTTAEKRTGAEHLTLENENAHRLKITSPFDYAKQTRILVVRDVNKNDLKQVAGAYRSLFMAAGGGALGLFTAIQRMKQVRAHLLQPMSEASLPLYSQHFDGIDIGTLIDMFRMEENACLLGTDAARDGVDVPGRALRLMVYDRVPWPRPNIMHKARREAFGKGYDDMLTRFKLKQAYGRLIRRATDKGVFIMLDSRLPTRLTTAFPAEVEIERIGLAEAIAITSDFLKKDKV